MLKRRLKWRKAKIIISKYRQISRKKTQRQFFKIKLRLLNHKLKKLEFEWRMEQIINENMDVVVLCLFH